MSFTKFKIKEHLFSFTPRYTITDEYDRLVAQVNKHAFSFSKKASYLNESGEVIFTISRKHFTFKRTYYIEKEGRRIFRIFKTFGFKPELFVESLTDTDAFVIQGNIWRSEYAFYKNGVEFAYVTRNIWKIADVYAAAIDEKKENKDTVLGLIIIIDLIQSSKRKRT